MRDLAEACEELLTQLQVFDLGAADDDRADAGLVTVTCLIAEADTDPGLRRSGLLESRPPWNANVAGAYLSAHQLVRRLEASLRLAVAGHPGRARGGSDANTAEAIRAIARMATAASVIPTAEPVSRSDPDGRKLTAAELAAIVLDRAIRVIGQLPAIDEFPKWEKIRAGPDGLPPRCPNCGTFSLRVAVQSGVVVCVLPSCADLDGNSPPQAHLDVSRLDGSPALVWRDGTVQCPPAALRQVPERDPAVWVVTPADGLGQADGRERPVPARPARDYRQGLVRIFVQFQERVFHEFSNSMSSIMFCLSLSSRITSPEFPAEHRNAFLADLELAPPFQFLPAVQASPGHFLRRRAAIPLAIIRSFSSKQGVHRP